MRNRTARFHRQVQSSLSSIEQTPTTVLESYQGSNYGCHWLLRQWHSIREEPSGISIAKAFSITLWLGSLSLSLIKHQIIVPEPSRDSCCASRGRFERFQEGLTDRHFVKFATFGSSLAVSWSDSIGDLAAGSLPARILLPAMFLIFSVSSDRGIIGPCPRLQQVPGQTRNSTMEKRKRG
jgi:hypothetical protein